MIIKDFVTRKFGKILLASLFPLALINPAIAESNYKTEGHYVGVDLISTRAEFHERFRTQSKDMQNQESYSNFGFGGGLSYKYAFNFDNFFIAPGVFTEFNNTEVHGKYKSTRNDLQSLEINNRTGIKADIGYDFDRISPFLTIGHAIVSYKSLNWTQYNSSAPIYQFENSGSNGSYFYGAGFNYKLKDNISVGFEYNHQDIWAKTTTPFIDNIGAKLWHGRYKTRLDIYKVGINYKF